jgi:hypothetical protein
MERNNMKNLQKDFLPFELSLKMKQLGFDKPCFGYYDEGGNLYIEMQEYLPAPLYQQAFRWFREKGYLISFSSHDTSIHDFYIKWQPSKSILSDTYDTYEEAELACLEKLCEIVEQKQK